MSTGTSTDWLKGIHEWDLGDMATTAWEINERAGWHARPTGELDRTGLSIALIHSECSELLEAVRKHGTESWYDPGTGKPEGAGSEIADILIRTLELAHILDIDVHAAVVEKMAFNERRTDVPTRGNDEGKRF